MAQNGGDKEDKFDAFTPEGKSLGYISLEQARVLAMQHARDNKEFYGPAHSRTNLVWEVSSQEEGEDYYDIRLSFRVVILETYYPGVYFFSTTPLQTPGHFQGLKIRSLSPIMTDLISGLGAEAQVFALGGVYPALERGIIDAAVGTADLAFGQRWYEVSKFMAGPMPSLSVTLLTMNQDQWNALASDLQEIIWDEAARHQQKSLRLASTVWLKQGIQEHIDQGMEYTELTPELMNAFREAAISTVLPNWVQRVGGLDSPVMKFYNNRIAPIVGIKVNPDGTASP